MEMKMSTVSLYGSQPLPLQRCVQRSLSLSLFGVWGVGAAKGIPKSQSFDYAMLNQLWLAAY